MPYYGVSILIMKKAKKSSDLLIGCLCAAGCEVIFGLSYVLTKLVTDSASELSLLCWRFLFAFITMTICLLLGLIKINLKGKKIGPLLVITLFDPVLYLLGETIGISHTTASESGIVLACIPVVSLLASTLILHKKPGKKQIIGILITLFGVFITVVAVGVSASFSSLGYAALFLAVVSYALYSVFVEKYNNYTSTEVTYLMVAGATIVFCIAALIDGIMNHSLESLITLPFHNSSFLISTLFQGICCSFLAFIFSNMAIAKIGVNRTSSFIGISTVVSIIARVFFLHEGFTAYQLVGAIIIVAGIYVANTRD